MKKKICVQLLDECSSEITDVICKTLAETKNSAIEIFTGNPKGFQITFTDYPHKQVARDIAGQVAMALLDSGHSEFFALQGVFLTSPELVVSKRQERKEFPEAKKKSSTMVNLQDLTSRFFGGNIPEGYAWKDLPTEKNKARKYRGKVIKCFMFDAGRDKQAEQFVNCLKKNKITVIRNIKNSSGKPAIIVDLGAPRAELKKEGPNKTQEKTVEKAPG